MEANSIWVTKTEAGFYARYRTAQSGGYLTPPSNQKPCAGYVSFPRLVQKIAGLNIAFYQADIELQIDENPPSKILEEEKDALFDVVKKLERLAKDVLVRDRKISKAKASLDSSLD